MNRMRLGLGEEIGRQPDGGTEPLAGEPAMEPAPGFAVGPLGRLAGGTLVPDLFGGIGGGVGAPTQPAPPPPSPPPGLAVAPGLVRPELPIERFPGRIRPFPLPFPLPVPVPISKTATQLATSAIRQLTDASPAAVREARNTITIKNIQPRDLLDHLERKVRVGEVLNQLAGTWSETTLTDFAEAFQMDRGKTDVMDAIVSIAILSNDELDQELLAENLPETTPQELLDNRVIVDQWPTGGTVMNPPYLVLVAVEYRSIAQAEDVVRSITGDLVEFEGARLPNAVVQRLRG